MQTNAVIEEIHQIREQLLSEASNDLRTAMQRAHEFSKSLGLKIIQGQPRRPLGWKEDAKHHPQ